MRISVTILTMYHRYEYAMFSSYYKCLISERRAHRWNWMYAVLVAFALGAAPMMLSERSVLFVGALPHRLWWLPFAGLTLALLAVPASAPTYQVVKASRLLPLAIFAFPLVPPE